MRTHLETIEKNVDELTKVLSIANKQKSQELHDLAFNSFILSHAVKSISYCSNMEVVFEWPLGSHGCNEWKSGFFVVTKQMPHSRHAKIIVEFNTSPLLKSLLPLLFAYLAFILLALFVGTKLRKRLSDDLLSIVTADVDEQSGSQITEVQELFEKVKAIQKNQLEAEKLRSLQSIYNQVAHDIRSPLSALSMVSATLTGVSEEKRALIIHATQRINDIANDLLFKSRHATPGIPRDHVILSTKGNCSSGKERCIEPTLLYNLVESIISEKRIQFSNQPGFKFEPNVNETYDLFVDIIPYELSRVISNIINNSIEAFSDLTGTVTVFIRKYGEEVSIVVQDDGNGIPPEILIKIGEQGFSYGKEGTQSGSGLGLWHAKKTIESFKGHFKVLSKVGVGTQVAMTLPITACPTWFQSSIQLKSKQKVISLDDDLSIHDIWRERIANLAVTNKNIEHISFTSAPELKKYLSRPGIVSPLPSLLLFDYELGEKSQTGLDIIQELNLHNDKNYQIVLVTNRFDDLTVRNRSLKMGVKLIPKNLIGLVPIKVEC